MPDDPLEEILTEHRWDCRMATSASLTIPCTCNLEAAREQARRMREALRWRPMSEAPRDGTMLIARSMDGLDTVLYETERACMSGPRAGSQGAGWVSVTAGCLPIDEPAEWIPYPKSVTCIQQSAALTPKEKT